MEARHWKRRFSHALFDGSPLPTPSATSGDADCAPVSICAPMNRTFETSLLICSCLDIYPGPDQENLSVSPPLSQGFAGEGRALTPRFSLARLHHRRAKSLIACCARFERSRTRPNPAYLPWLRQTLHVSKGHRYLLGSQWPFAQLLLKAETDLSMLSCSVISSLTFIFRTEASSHHGRCRGPPPPPRASSRADSLPFPGLRRRPSLCSLGSEHMAKA